MSTDAIILYGYAWDDEEKPWANEDREDIDEVRDMDTEEYTLRCLDFAIVDDPEKDEKAAIDSARARHQGNRYDWERIKRKVAEQFYNNNRERYRKKWDAQRAALRALTFDCEIGTHCSGDAPMYFVKINESERRANRGYPLRIIPSEDLVEGEDWNARLAQFCELLRTPPRTGGFGWFICSNWGQQ